MRGLEDGHTCVVTRNGEPVGELRPLRRHRLVDARVAVEVFRTAPPVDAWRLRDDLDRSVDQDIDARG
jgi:antitoxin (DNA-binding transcriptional repressor) of toxin-antitoxin stability system